MAFFKCLRRLILFPTFVVLAMLAISPRAMSAKGSPQPDMDDHAQDAVHSQADPTLNQTIDIGKPPPAPPQAEIEQDFFYPYRNSLTVRIGEALVSSSVTSGGTETLFGVAYSFTAPSFKIYEAGADLLADGTGEIHFSRKIVYSKTSFRPYIKVGVGLLIVPADNLVTFIKYQNYQIRASMGFEQILWIPKSVRLELEGALGGNTAQVAATLGYVFAW